MALRFVDNSGDQVNFGAPASAATLPIGTVAFWIKPANVSNSLRQIFTKSVTAGPNGWKVFRRGATGTVYAIQVSRSVTHQVVDTGATMTASEWQMVFFMWNVTSGGPKAYRGTLVTPPVEVTTAGNNGSGTQVDDSASDICLGTDDGGTTASIPADIAWAALWNRNLTPSDTEQVFQATRSRIFGPVPLNLLIPPGLMLHTFLGEMGANTQIDYSSYANRGTVTTATVCGPTILPFPTSPVWAATLARPWPSAPAGRLSRLSLLGAG